MANSAAATVGWGLIGASNIASEHMIRAIRAQPGHEVVSVFSADAERGRAWAAEHGVARAAASLDELLADPAVHVVYISTTNDRHRDQAIAAARAGRHVLCEKPLALTVDDALAMRDACRQAGVLLATNHHLRNSAAHRAIRDELRAGSIGRPLFARVFHAILLRHRLQGWRVADPAAGGGVVLDIVVHDADVLRFVLGAEPVEVSAMVQSAGMGRDGAEDGVMAVVRFDDGVLAQIHAAFTVPYAGTGIEIHGEKGSIVARDVMTQRAVGEVVVRTDQGERSVPLQHVDLYREGVAAFCRALAGQGRPVATGDDGVRSLAVALAVAQAARSGRTVQVDADHQRALS